MGKKNGLIEKEQAPIEDPQQDIANDELPEWVETEEVSNEEVENTSEDVSEDKAQEPQAHNPYPGVGTRAYRSKKS